MWTTQDQTGLSKSDKLGVGGKIGKALAGSGKRVDFSEINNLVSGALISNPKESIETFTGGMTREYGFFNSVITSSDAEVLVEKTLSYCLPPTSWLLRPHWAF